MKTEELINSLHTSKLFAVCPCGGEFKIADAILFDGTKDFPKEAVDKQEELKQQLRTQKRFRKKEGTCN